MDRLEVDFNPGGLGTTIQLICTFMEFKKPVLWLVRNGLESQKEAILQIIKIFNIPESQLKVKFTKKGTGTKSSDITKFFSPYTQPDFISIHGTVEKVNHNTQKRYIGICLYGGRESFNLENATTVDEWPYRKMWPLETYSEIISKIIEAGYDIISLDNTCTTVEDKVHLMNSYCDAVIGYEGGIHHLAHLLKIPSIILPWREPMPGEYIDCLHLDTRTYQVKSLDEIQNWNQHYLETLISDLKNEKEFNNFWLTAPVTFTSDLRNYWVHRSADVVNYGSLMWIPKNELELLIENLKSIKVGGLQNITYKD